VPRIKQRRAVKLTIIDLVILFTLCLLRWWGRGILAWPASSPSPCTCSPSSSDSTTDLDLPFFLDLPPVAFFFDSAESFFDLGAFFSLESSSSESRLRFLGPFPFLVSPASSDSLLADQLVLEHPTPAEWQPGEFFVVS
jgi:hypothetical protein